MFKIKEIVINIMVGMLNVIYLPFKMLKTQNKITYLSRQSNIPSIDFKLLVGQVERVDGNIKQVVMCKKIPKGIFGKIGYCVHMLSQMYHIATSKVVVVDTYVIAVSVLKHKNNLKVIQIWHALGAIKKFGYQVLDKAEGSSKVVAESMRMHKNYDIVTCASNATALFYRDAFGIDLDKIKIVGMPRVDDILACNKNKEILESNPEYNNKKTILYIPTFRKEETVNVEDLVENCDHEKYNLIVRLHPLDNTKVEEEYLVKGNFTTYDLMKFADYIITDYSATAIEASLLDKPLYLYVYDMDKYMDARGLNVNLTEELSNNTSKSAKEILEKINNNDCDFEQLTKFKKKYIETYNINNTESVGNTILELFNN